MTSIFHVAEGDTTPRFYSGIGSRETPEDVLEVMQGIGWAMATLGYRLRSGGADKADTAFMEGAIKAAGDVPGLAEIYLPWKNFSKMPTQSDILTSSLFIWEDAKTIASTIHPAWEKFEQDPDKYRGVMALHTRNVCQILGQDLETPSVVVYCYAEPVGKEGQVKGGTGTAVKLALSKGIKVVNLYHPESLTAAKQFVERVLVKFSTPDDTIL